LNVPDKGRGGICHGRAIKKLIRASCGLLVIEFQHSRAIKKLIHASCGLLVIEIQHSAEPFSTPNRPVATKGIRSLPRKQKSVVFSLMSAFMMVVSDIFCDGMLERGFAKENHSVEAFFFDRFHESFSERIEIRTSGRKRQWFDSGGSEDHVETGSELGVSIADQMPASREQVASAAGEITGDLTHPGIRRIPSDPGDVDLSAADVDEEEAVIGNQPKCGPDFGGEEIGGEQAVGVRLDEVGPTGFTFAGAVAGQGSDLGEFDSRRQGIRPSIGVRHPLFLKPMPAAFPIPFAKPLQEMERLYAGM